MQLTARKCWLSKKPLPLPLPSREGDKVENLQLKENKDTDMKKYIKPETIVADMFQETVLAASRGGVKTGDMVGKSYNLNDNSYTKKYGDWDEYDDWDE